jgi:undecaprenyl-diphosphatase
VPAVLAAAFAVLLLSRRPELDPASPHAASVAAHELAHHRRAARFLRRHLDPRSATGLALLAGLVLVVAGGLVVGGLALLVRAHVGLQGVDDSVAPWGTARATPFAHDVVDAVTQLGSTRGLLVVVVLVAIVESIRRPNTWLPVFLAVVALGQPVLTNTVKDLLERVRPTIDAGAAALGPSFPSGHSAGAAACYAAVALVLGRGRARGTHAWIAGGAVFVAVAVATSRVLLGVHWLSDVIGGLALGWAWFAVCAIAFGGRMLRFGAPVEAVERVVSSQEQSASARR